MVSRIFYAVLFLPQPASHYRWQLGGRDAAGAAVVVRKHSLLSDYRVNAQQQLLLCEIYVFRHSKFNIHFCRAASRSWQLSSTAYSMYQHLKQFTAVSISAVHGLALRRDYSTNYSTIPINSCTIQKFGAQFDSRTVTVVTVGHYSTLHTDSRQPVWSV